MRYLTIGADYTQSCVRDEFAGPVEPELIGASTALCAEIRSWNEEYRRVIPLDEGERRDPEIEALISRLDQRGLRIARAIQESTSDVKVRYFSEGHLRYCAE